jgi:molybdate transport system regulatory protein
MTQVGPLKLKAQILCGGELAMGPGKADLLETIDREGSISAAGRAMGMSYRRTWQLVDTMNRCWAEPLVDTKPGGGRETGSRLTDCGRAVLQAYRSLEAALAAAAANKAFGQLTDRLLPEPRAAREKAAS